MCGTGNDNTGNGNTVHFFRASAMCVNSLADVHIVKNPSILKSNHLFREKDCARHVNKFCHTVPLNWFMLETFKCPVTGTLFK